MNEMPLLFAFIMMGFFIVMIAGMWLLLIFLPRWTRPELYFSVTVLPSFRQTAEGRQIEHRYRKLVAVHSMIGLCLVLNCLLVRNQSGIFIALLVGGVFWQTFGVVAAVAAARKQVFAYAVSPSPIREATIQPRQAFLIGRWWWMGPLLILTAFSTYLCFRWQEIPTHFPIHWGPSGQPDGWASRSIAGVFMLPIVGATNWSMMLMIAWAMGRFSRRIYAGGPGAKGEQTLMHITQWVLLGAAYWSALVTGTLSLLPFFLKENDPTSSWLFAIIGVELVLVAITIIILARMGQGGWRLSEAAVESAEVNPQPTGDRTPDAAWKLGLFYYNPSDPALFVEKRFGIGWDLNWGRPAAWGLMAAVLIVPLIVTIILLGCLL